jgi:hypothetical protein
MISPSNLRGVIRGKTIELTNDPGLKEGQEVEITLRPMTKAGSWGTGLQRCAGALADSWQPEDDSILEQIQDSRKRSTGRDLPS